MRSENSIALFSYSLPGSDLVNQKQLLLTHLLIPGMLMFALVMVLNYTPLDLAFSWYFFDENIRAWAFHDTWLFRTLLHDWAQKVNILFLLVILGSFLHARFIGRQRLRARAFSYLFLASSAGPAIIGILKNTTHIYCPRDLVMFGGDKPLVHLFDSVDPSLPVGHCFPGGHSGSGFALVSLYYFFLMLKPQHRVSGLLAGLFIGVLYALVQEIRGAHMPSHDVTSLAICWGVSTLIYLLYRERGRVQDAKSGEALTARA